MTHLSNCCGVLKIDQIVLQVLQPHEARIVLLLQIRVPVTGILGCRRLVLFHLSIARIQLLLIFNWYATLMYSRNIRIQTFDELFSYHVFRSGSC